MSQHRGSLTILQSYGRLAGLLLCGILLRGETARAMLHDVPDRFFERTVQVQIEPRAITVTYQLSLSQFTLAQELLALVGIGGIDGQGPDDRMRQFGATLGPTLARGVILEIDDHARDLEFVSSTHVQEDHPRFQFRLESKGDFGAEREHRLKLEDTNFFMEKGRVRMSIGALKPCVLDSIVAPTEPEVTKATWELTPEQQDAARRLEARWSVRTVSSESTADQSAIATAAQERSTVEATPTATGAGHLGMSESTRELTGLLDRWSDGFYGALLLMAFLFGAAHAMTPGHGKTMVAAYLVGERGTLRHAVGLGLTTSLTHTSSVLAVALLLWLVGPAIQDHLTVGFSLVSGLLVASLGGYLLLLRLRAWRRRSAIARQIETACPEGCVHGAKSPPNDGSPVPGWSGLITLGISGGIVPCWDAVVLLLIATAQGQVDRAIYLLLSFSAGLAGTLVLVGVLAVQLRGFLSSRFASGRLAQSLPIVSAAAILVVGVYLCVLTLHQPGNASSLAIPATHRVAGP